MRRRAFVFVKERNGEMHNTCIHYRRARLGVLLPPDDNTIVEGRGLWIGEKYYTILYSFFFYYSFGR